MDTELVDTWTHLYGGTDGWKLLPWAFGDLLVLTSHQAELNVPRNMASQLCTKNGNVLC